MTHIGLVEYSLARYTAQWLEYILGWHCRDIARTRKAAEGRVV